MSFLYNIFIIVYKFGIGILSVFDEKTKQIVTAQKDLKTRIYNATKNHENIVWFHASSLGEFEQGKSVIKLYRNENPTHKILLTFYSPSGYNIVKNNEIADWVFYLPHDTKRNAVFMYENVNPIKVIFIKYEFWFNYIQTLYKQKIPIYFISVVLRKEQYFFKIYGRWFAKQLQKVDHFFVQDTNTSDLLKSININDVTVCGDSRFDTVISNSEETFESKIIEKFCNKQQVLIAGSAWGKDIDLLKNIPEGINYKIIIAPHELNQIDKLKKLKNSVLLSEINDVNVTDKKILIIDKIGVLSKIYRFADIAYIGGGFGKGIHNCLEAAVYNIPILFGPNHHNFIEATDLISIGIAKEVNSSESLIKEIKYLREINVKPLTEKYFKEKSGSSKYIVKHI